MDTLCKIRDMYRAIAEFEARFEKVYQLGLNEGMVLCCLSRMEKLSSGEIAEQLNISINSVRTLKQNAYKKLRGLLKDYFYLLFLVDWTRLP